MSSSRPVASLGCAALALVLAWPHGAAAQEAPQAGGVTAEQALETARDAYAAPEEQRVAYCPQDSVEERAERQEGEGEPIVVCRRVLPEYQFQTRDGPSGDLGRTADGVPRAPNIETIPSCVGRAMLGVCVTGIGSVPPPVIMVDLTKIPEPLAPEVAAKVLRAPSADDPPPPPVTGERVPIPID